MAGIVTAAVSPRSCGHYDLNVSIDGQAVVLHVHEAEAQTPLTTDEIEAFLRLGMRRLRASGVTLAQFLNRVLIGDEATNVKQYPLIAPGSAVTLTNIGTAYVNLLPGANGQRSLVDFTGCTQFRLVLTANLIGTGPFGARVIKDSDNTVLFESASIAQTGERELDSDWQTIPAGFTALEVLRVQGKSVTAADDPVFRRMVLLVR